MSRILFTPFAPAIVFNIVAFAIFLLTTHQGRPLPFPAIALATYSSVLLGVAGIEADARRRRLTPCFDFGWLFWVFLPWSAIWYGFRSRGLSGILLMGLLFALWIGPAVCATLASDFFPVPPGLQDW